MPFSQDVCYKEIATGKLLGYYRGHKAMSAATGRAAVQEMSTPIWIFTHGTIGPCTWQQGDQLVEEAPCPAASRSGGKRNRSRKNRKNRKASRKNRSSRKH